ncbi:MAG: hypothetical protein KBS55_00300 [Bacteroidales bacterium]|nr:hypothetical protein [Candidatus Cryptobacteroides aphodequi]
MRISKDFLHGNAFLHIQQVPQIVATDGTRTESLPLPIGGIISDLDGDALSAANLQIEEIVRSSGCAFASPFITLGFMALPVIPELKLTDKGLFDGNSFSFID